MKNRLALERARNLDIVIFDKTGTLTRGMPILSGIQTASLRRAKTSYSL
ncbi:hypothetical protein [Edaphobacter bradus]|nr:hypothetical protein [Edaphobacter bradus]